MDGTSSKRVFSLARRPSAWVAMVGAAGLTACASAPRQATPSDEWTRQMEQSASGGLESTAVTPASSTKPVGPHLLGVGAHETYREPAFFAQSGSSAQSMEQAENAARQRVAQQIQSRIESVFQERMREDSAGQSSSTVDRVIRVTSQFSRGNLITIADRGQKDGVFYAFAVLDRAKADQSLGSEYDVASAEFRTAADNALAAVGNAREFTGAWSRASALWKVLEGKGLELEALDKSGASRVRDDRRRRSDLLAARQNVLRDFPVRLAAKGAYSDQIASVMNKALKKIGVDVSSNPAGGVPLEVEVTESLPRGVGVCCSWSLALTVDGQPVAMSTAPVGCHHRDRGMARANVVRELENAVPDELRRHLSTVLPLEN